MMLCRRALLGSVFALAALASVGPATAKELTILTSVPGLNFPFFVHMLKAMEAEVSAQGATPLEATGRTTPRNRPPTSRQASPRGWTASCSTRST